ncbi:AlkA N-terminal domain-containing protein [Lysobacter soyae]|nr:AlkA N-terminal domain-containing protein [Lysobacter sp. CJ11]
MPSLSAHRKPDDVVAPHMPSRDACDAARQSKDARFDGLFFTAVKTTGIYCRPVCPAPTPKAGNVDYYPSAASAEAAGFRPCLRCRPELSPADGGWRRGDDVVARAVRLVEAGMLDTASLAQLADRMHVGERHLRRLFVSRLGTSPKQVQATKRLLFAKQLLTETALPVTEIALASGFQSLRRFNDAFLSAYGLAPSRLRKTTGHTADGSALNLRLVYRPPFEFGTTLAFLSTRALAGLEHVDVEARTYRRLIDDRGAWLSVSEWGRNESALRLTLHGVRAHAIPELVQRVRRMFDLDADMRAVHDVLRNDPRLATTVTRHPGLRLAGGWDGLEMATRAIVGQQVSVAAARTLATRLLQRTGTRLTDSPVEGLEWIFPTAETLAAANLDGMGLTGRRVATLQTMASAVARGDATFDAHLPLNDFIERWCALPGIGEWTAHYLALRALGHPDAFPAGDLVLRQQLQPGTLVSEATLRQRSKDWQPWRAYAALHLWRAALPETGTSP